MKVKNISGQTFSNLTALYEVGRNKQGYSLWLCKCVCGAEKIVSRKALTAKGIKGCGCSIGKHLYKHGLSATTEYKRLKVLRRNEKKKQLDSNWSVGMELALQELFPYCVLCGGRNKLATDHVLPLSRGYGLTPGNATRLCAKCNSSKGCRLVSELDQNTQVVLLTTATQFKEFWNTYENKYISCVR